MTSDQYAWLIDELESNDGYDIILLQHEGLNGTYTKFDGTTYVVNYPAIDINSILSLNKAGWSIKYPKGIEVYENKRKKPAIIIGVLGNRNKGKSFILGNYLDMMFLKAFL